MSSSLIYQRQIHLYYNEKTEWRLTSSGTSWKLGSSLHGEESETSAQELLNKLSWARLNCSAQHSTVNHISHTQCSALHNSCVTYFQLRSLQQFNKDNNTKIMGHFIFRWDKVSDLSLKPKPHRSVMVVAMQTVWVTEWNKLSPRGSKTICPPAMAVQLAVDLHPSVDESAVCTHLVASSG